VYSVLDFIIPNEFNDVVEHKASLFLMLSKVIQELMQVSRARILILQNLKNKLG
jgi:hypothetical protein